MKNLKFLALSLFLILSACAGQSVEEGKTTKVDPTTFIKNRFPIQKLPYKIDVMDLDSTLMLNRSEIEQFFPEVAANSDRVDVYAIGSFQIFDGLTTILFAQEWTTIDYYLASFPKNEFSVESTALLPHIGFREEGPESIGTLYENGSLITEDSNDGVKFSLGAKYQLTRDNKLE